MIAAIQDQIDLYYDQKELVSKALEFVFQQEPGYCQKQSELSEYAIALHAGELDESGYYSAFLALKTSRAKLKKAGYELPQAWDCKLEATQTSDCSWHVVNVSKQTGYTVTTDEFGQNITGCECDRFKFGGWCAHADLVDSLIGQQSNQIDQNFNQINQPDDQSCQPDDQSFDHLKTILPGVELTDGQAIALYQLIEFANGINDRHLLTGYAGAGKSSLVQALIRYLKSDRPDLKIVFTAFTNKAVKVLRNMVGRWRLKIDCMTCHSLLGLKAIEVEDRIEFQVDPNGEDKSDRYDLIVVDECSMINSQMWEFLGECLQKILFVGDIAQIPPVGEDESLTFTVSSSSHLTEVVRYGGAIGVAVEEVRNNLSSKRLPRFETLTSEDGKEGIFTCTPAQWEQRLIKAFQSPQWQQNSDFVKAIAFTNARVESINQRVRAAIYGVKVPQFINGDRLVAYKPVAIDGQPAFLQTSDECLVNRVTRGSVGEWQTWFLEATNDQGQEHVLTVLDKSDRRKYEATLEDYRKEKRWFQYHNLLKQFDDVRYSFAITAHKSQGSTYTNAFIDVQDMAKMPRGRTHKERNQLIYTACTRAAKRLLILQPEG